jgi:hypothetical protein
VLIVSYQTAEEAANSAGALSTRPSDGLRLLAFVGDDLRAVPGRITEYRASFPPANRLLIENVAVTVACDDLLRFIMDGRRVLVEYMEMIPRNRDCQACVLCFRRQADLQNVARDVDRRSLHGRNLAVVYPS